MSTRPTTAKARPVALSAPTRKPIGGMPPRPMQQTARSQRAQGSASSSSSPYGDAAPQYSARDVCDDEQPSGDYSYDGGYDGNGNDIMADAADTRGGVSSPEVSMVKTETNKTAAMSTTAGQNTNAPEKTDDTTTDNGIKKVSLSKTTGKLRVVEPVGSSKPSFKPASDDGTYKPVLGNMEADGISAAALGTSTMTSGPARPNGAIDPRRWLQKRNVPTTVTPTPTTDVDSDNQMQVTASSTTVVVEEEVMQMFWLDACESNGVLYLFGKVALKDLTTPPTTNDSSTATATATTVKEYVSCCVAVHGSERNLFVLPRVISGGNGGFKADGKPIRACLVKVYKELSNILVPDIIPCSQGQAFRCKGVKRKYAFEHGEIPRDETEYLKVVYSAKYSVPNAKQCQGGEYIERIFGSTCSSLELFLLKRKIMGPCWITIRNPRTLSESMSWCTIEVGIENPKFITKTIQNEAPSSTPPLVSMCVSMKTVVNPFSHLHEIVALSALIHTKVDADSDAELNPQHMRRFTLIRQLGTTCGTTYPSTFPHDLQAELKRNIQASSHIQTFPNERAMLSSFFAKLQQEDPDILSSHNLFGFEFDVLLTRAIENKLSDWSRLGRLRRTRIPKNINDKDITSGRILCDTYKSAKEFLR